MNKTLLVIILSMVLISFSLQNRIEFENPLPVKFGDPFIMRASDGIYYMIGTGGIKDGFKMYSSNDLKSWKDEGCIYQGNTKNSWNVANFWAPELYEINGRF